MRTRCKMMVSSVEPAQHNADEQIVKMYPHYDKEGIPEDEHFAKYTPAGSLELTISNPRLVGEFKQGDFFYLDLVRIDQD